MLFSSPSTSRKRRGVAAGASVAMILSVGVAAWQAPAVATPAVPVAAATAADDKDTFVALGDSYMSGEGVMISNHNFKGDTINPGGDASWLTANGTWSNVGGDPVQLKDGQISYKNQANAKMWGSVFGNANGWPEVVSGAPQGIEELLYCDNSFAAAGQVGEGWNVHSFACSGATQPSQGGDKLKEKTGCTLGFLGCRDYYYAKPGVNGNSFSVQAPTQKSPVEGQAESLAKLATTNKGIAAVGLSIGGNDFGFGDIGKSCIISGLVGGGCQSQQSTLDKVKAGLEITPVAVKDAITSVTEAMASAGYEQDEWKLVYQNPPLPVSDGADTKSENRLALGCELPDSTFDWIAGVGQYEGKGLYPQLAGAMQEGLKRSRTVLGDTPVVQIDTTDTFEGHRLCEKGTTTATGYTTTGAGRDVPWQKNNGKDTEWITYVDLGAQITGNRYQKSMPLHPNYWGQRALAACMAKAIEVDAGSVAVDCTQDASNDLDAEGRPKMNIAQAETLWIMVVGKPAITGSPNVGQVLTADAGDAFAPADSYDYEYQWLADDVAIDGATGATYTPVAGDLGKDIKVTVTASKAALDPVSATSLPVTVSDLIVNTAPSISGTPQVGGTLTANPGTYTPTPDATAIQWLADGEVIAGATGTTFVPTAEYLGKRISVRVTATKAGFIELVIFSAETQEVSMGQTAATGRPIITGTPKLGETLTADKSAVAFTPEASRESYRWYRDGEFISGATESTYAITDDDRKKSLTVSVVGESDGHSSVESQQSEAVGPVSAGKITVTGKAVIKYVNNVEAMSSIPKRKARYGKNLALDLVNVFSEWPTNAKITWDLKKGNSTKRIKSAQDLTTYRPKLSDIGSQLRAEITTRNEGYDEATTSTAWYTIVKGKYAVKKAPKIHSAAKAQANTKAKVGAPLVATRAVFVPRTGDVEYQWLRGSTKIKGADSRRYTPTSRDVGKKLRIKAYVPASKGYTYAQVVSKATKPVKKTKGLG